jgi:hypothetical protein
MIHVPPGDNPALFDEVYQLPTSLVTVVNGVATHQETVSPVEIWINPATGESEPFVMVRLDKNGRLPRYETRLLTVVEEAEKGQRPFPDWGGLKGESVGDTSLPPKAILLGLLAAVTTGILWLARLLLR